jgi:aspartate carbamoyltransferase catalytic subunit
MQNTLTIPHLVDIKSLSRDQIISLIHMANNYLTHDGYQQLTLLDGKSVATVFYENSTRTRISFQLAARQLGAQVIDFSQLGSSVQKGESLTDTIATLIAMGIDRLVVRHSDEGTVATLANTFGNKAHFVNAGDGASAHPTQALLDMLTIWQHKSHFEPLRVAIVGDILYSRVARSQINALHCLGVSNIRVIAPSVLLPQEIETWPVTICDNLSDGLTDADVIICLRMQKERMPLDLFPDVNSYHQSFGVKASDLANAKPDAIVMHPGPMNRGIEIDNTVADSKQSVILQQVRNGVAMRMAILAAIAM